MAEFECMAKLLKDHFGLVPTHICGAANAIFFRSDDSCYFLQPRMNQMHFICTKKELSDPYLGGRSVGKFLSKLAFTTLLGLLHTGVFCYRTL